MVRRVELPKIYESDIQKIHSFLKRKYFSFRNVRNQAIIALLTRTGIKTEPLISLNIDEYNKRQGVITPTHPKAPQQIKLDEKTRKILNHYLFLRQGKLFSNLPFYYSNYRYKKILPLFINDYRQELRKDSEELRLSPRQIQRIVKEFAKRYQLSNDFTPKTFRHIAGLYYASLGLDNVTIDSILGNVAPWVKTDYRRLSRLKEKLLSKRRKNLQPKCKHHNVLMEEIKHRKHGIIWLCPIRGCLYVLDDSKIQINIT